MKSPEAPHWRLAEQAELDSMLKHEVFTQMVLPPGKKAIDTRWVYALKYKDGTIYKYKARLVAEGYEQIYCVDFEETFALVARLTSLRIVLAIAAKLQFDVQQMDVETAFLNATLVEEVYIKIPDGVTVAHGCNCIRLNKALYGLKQSPREWYDNINTFLQSLKFKRLQSEHCLYIYSHDDEICLISLYVDDLIIAGTDASITNIYEDNKACLDYSKNSTSHQRTKHISVRYHFIRDLIQERTTQLIAIPSADNVADIFTKPLDKRVFQYLRGKFMHNL